MGAADLPPDASNAKQPAKATEVRKMKSPSEDGLKKIIEKINKNSVPSSQTMTNEGQISKMSIPDGWSRSTVKHTLPAAANFVEYHSDKAPDTKLVTYYRGHRISPTAGKKFHELLAGSPRELTGAEYASLGEVVRDMSRPEDFEVTGKRVIKLNGRNVLLVEGRFKEIKQLAHALYIDADGTGEVVQEILYQAPEAAYGEHKKEAEAALNSISWK
jgi:hypothetical protein